MVSFCGFSPATSCRRLLHPLAAYQSLTGAFPAPLTDVVGSGPELPNPHPPRWPYQAATTARHPPIGHRPCASAAVCQLDVDP